MAWPVRVQTARFNFHTPLHAHTSAFINNIFVCKRYRFTRQARQAKEQDNTYW